MLDIILRFLIKRKLEKSSFGKKNLPSLQRKVIKNIKARFDNDEPLDVAVVGGIYRKSQVGKTLEALLPFLSYDPKLTLIDEKKYRLNIRGARPKGFKKKMKF